MDGHALVKQNGLVAQPRPIKLQALRHNPNTVESMVSLLQAQEDAWASKFVARFSHCSVQRLVCCEHGTEQIESNYIIDSKIFVDHSPVSEYSSVHSPLVLLQSSPLIFVLTPYCTFD